MLDLDTDIIVNATVVRAVDENGKITDDPTKVVEGEVRLTAADGRSEIFVVARQPERRPAIVSA